MARASESAADGRRHGMKSATTPRDRDTANRTNPPGYAVGDRGRHERISDADPTGRGWHPPRGPEGS